MTALLVWLILLLPLLAALVITLFLQANRELSARLSIGAVVVPFWLSVMLWFDRDLVANTLEFSVTWLAVGDLTVAFGLRLDPLSLLMLLVVTSVGGAIQIYSYDYLREDVSLSRYFACMSFFMFSMLGIVLANNFFMLFFFWELVGISSYLLIGYWYERPAAADAGKKAFLINRLGDAGFLMGIILLWANLGSVHFAFLEQKLLANPKALGALTTLAGLLIFCGAMGKSAQFPLHVWLPDAMEGPTPVSALIHAATMVAAGVFMLCRVYFLLQLPPQWPTGLTWLQAISPLDVIACVGLVTALLSALIAIQQNDIKRILAYSTLSQLGYMIMAIGLGGPAPAMFHLTTHACFKALLFLGAGSVIYALHHEQDIWKMGALRLKMPVTFWTFLLAALALCGVPPLSGFFSKDAILSLAAQKNVFLFIPALGVAFLTAFYMFRLIQVAFLGRPKSAACHQAHDSTRIMLQPMLFLTVPTMLLGFWGADSLLDKYFHPDQVEAVSPWFQQIFLPFTQTPLAAFAGLGAVAFGYFVASELYRSTDHDPLPAMLGKFSTWMCARFYFDELYNRSVVWTQEVLARFADGFDRYFIAGVGVRGLHGTIEFVGRVLRLLQSGNLQAYAFVFTIGVVLLLLYALK